MTTRGIVMTERRTLIDELLDFDPAEKGPGELMIGWKVIAAATGFSEDTLQRCCNAHQIELPRWGPPTDRSPVFLPKVKVTILRRIVMAGF